MHTKVDRDSILDYDEWLRAGVPDIEPGDVVVCMLFSNMQPMGYAVRKAMPSGRLGEVLGEGWIVDLFAPKCERSFISMDEIGLFTKGGRNEDT